MTSPFEALDQEARVLTLEHAARSASGEVDDPSVISAVVGIERLAELIGTTDESAIRATLEAPSEGRLADLVTEIHELVIDALGRRDSGWRADAGILNPDAGMYDVAYDLDLLRAAVRASVQSFAEEPYYFTRYGPRGTAFAASDSCWLVRLIDFDVDYSHQQVMWLAGLLAGRGMPTWLTQLHLEHLISQVRAIGKEVGAVPDVVERMRTERAAIIDDAFLDSAASRGIDAVDGIPHAGALVAAAIADERGGWSRHDGGIWDWLIDPERCSDDGFDVLEAIRDEAREV